MPYCRKSATCTHISALLHALVAMTPTQLTPIVSGENVTEEDLPVTSYPCRWKPPCKRKESNLKISDANVTKHTYGKQRKVELSPLEEFDPRPHKYRGSAPAQLTAFLGKVRGKGLGVSLLFDPSTQYWTPTEQPSSESQSPSLPCCPDLRYTIEKFKKSLKISEEEARKIERNTREQRLSSLWYSVRRYRLTASSFGEIFRRRPETIPDALVLKLLQRRQISSPAIEWGVQQEPRAIEAYKTHQHSVGHQELTVCPVGFLVCQEYPFLGASPDGGVYDLASDLHPFGFVEVKCPYSHHDNTPVEACSDPSFCCELKRTSCGDTMVVLKHSHPYYCQVQGQLGIGNKPWCDFVIYTRRGLNVERIHFDQVFWNNRLLPKLIEFYDNCMAPEIVSPIHMLGMPLRDLRKE